MAEVQPQRPVLLVVAGPNGSGKTELTTNILDHNWADGCEYINPDFIARDRFGDWNSPQAVADAARYATELRYKLLDEGKSIANLAEVLAEVDRAYVYDNSVDDRPAEPQFRTREGAVFKIYSQDHAWARKLYSVTDDLDQRAPH